MGFIGGLLVSNQASFEGRREGRKGQGAGGVQVVWIGVEMWETGRQTPWGLQPFSWLTSPDGNPAPRGAIETIDRVFC